MNEQLEQLERDGYTLVRDFLPRDMTAKIRAHMDSLLPPVSPRGGEASRVHTLRHPIPGAIMAEILDNPRLLELAQQILESQDLRLLEQVLIRTDPSEAEPGASHAANGWHLDMTFMPEHFHARPRQTYFHMVHVLNTIPAGGGATHIIPGSHHKAYAAAQRLGVENLDQLKSDPIGVAGLDLNDAIEAQANEGDLLVFNPMCLHSASANHSASPRYVYFASFMDESATYLQKFLRDTGYSKGFPDSLRDNLRPELHSLLS